MQEIHQSLRPQMGKMETEGDQTAAAVPEVQAHIGILDEVMSWTPIGEESRR